MEKPGDAYVEEMAKSFWISKGIAVTRITETDMYRAGFDRCWNTYVVSLLQKIKEQDEFIEEGLDRNDRFDRAEKQWYDLHLKDQADKKALREEIERLKDQILEQGELDGN